MEKKTTILLIVLLGTVASFPLLAKLKRERTGKEQPEALPQGPAVEVQEPEAPVSALMTRELFFRLQPGMSYTQCVSLIGSEGEPAPSGHGGIEVYRWFDAEGKTEFNLSFQNGRLQGKGFNSLAGNVVRHPQGLGGTGGQVPAHPYWNAYNRISEGMTYGECVAILGVDGVYLGKETGQSGRYDANGNPVSDVLSAYVWRRPGDAAQLKISFRNGRVATRHVDIPSGSGDVGQYGGGRH